MVSFRLSPLIVHAQAESDWLVLTHVIPPAFVDGVHKYRQPPSVQSRVYLIMRLRAIAFTTETLPAQGQ